MKPTACMFSSKYCSQRRVILKLRENSFLMSTMMSALIKNVSCTCKLQGSPHASVRLFISFMMNFVVSRGKE